MIIRRILNVVAIVVGTVFLLTAPPSAHASAYEEYWFEEDGAFAHITVEVEGDLSIDVQQISDPEFIDPSDAPLCEGQASHILVWCEREQEGWRHRLVGLGWMQVYYFDGQPHESFSHIERKYWCEDGTIVGPATMSVISEWWGVGPPLALIITFTPLCDPLQAYIYSELTVDGSYPPETKSKLCKKYILMPGQPVEAPILSPISGYPQAIQLVDQATLQAEQSISETVCSGECALRHQQK